MHIAFLNPQGNFDPEDRYWTEHADFGGQLVYVKEVALALGRMGHKVDIITRLIQDSEWIGFEGQIDHYRGEPNVRIVRIPCGGDLFLRKEVLWPYLGTEWVPSLQDFYARENAQPGIATAHYGDGGLAGAIWQLKGGPSFTFTGHSLGAQKLDRLLDLREQELAVLDEHYHFARRIAAERVAMNHAARVVTSTRQERFEQYGHVAYQGAIDTEDDTKFATIPPGVNLRIFDIEPQQPLDTKIEAYLDEVLARDITPDRVGLPVIISSSRLDPKKNIVGLVQAYAGDEFLQQYANLLLVVRGIQDIHSRDGLSSSEGEILDAIVEIASQSDLMGKISAFPLNSQQELAATYRVLSHRHSVFALTALYEPFGLAPLEAMAAGLPAVVTRNGGPSESLREGGRSFGVLVDPSDPEAIAHGLLRVLSPEGEWEAFQRAGRDRVLSKYTWEQTARGYLETIQDLKSPNPTLEIPQYFFKPTEVNDVSVESLSSFLH